MARLTALVAVFSCLTGARTTSAQTPALDAVIDSIEWYGAASVMIVADGKTIYVDPFDATPTTRSADVILVTHPHQRHFSVETIRRLARPRHGGDRS
jgi:hypothetical protein